MRGIFSFRIQVRCPFCLFSYWRVFAGLQSPKIYRNKHETCKAPLLSFLIRKKACSKCQIHLKKAIHQARIHFKLFFPYLLSRIDTQRHLIYYIEFYSINYAMSFKFHTINVYCQGFCSNGVFADTRNPYLKVLIYTMGKTI